MAPSRRPFGRPSDMTQNGPSRLGLIDEAIATTSRLRDSVAPGAPLWLTETGETACGGNRWAATFTDVFRFTDQMARSAKQGVSVYIHNTLAASDYGLLDEQTDRPRPNYWSAWLWRKFMGTKVLDAGQGTTGLHVYAHCLRGRPGGVAFLAINLDEANTRTINTGSSAQVYSLRQGASPANATLNGALLALGPDGELPKVTGRPLSPGALKLPPASVNYVIFAEAGNPASLTGLNG